MRNKGKVKKKDHQEKRTQEPDIKTQKEFSLQRSEFFSFSFYLCSTSHHTSCAVSAAEGGSSEQMPSLTLNQRKALYPCQDVFFLILLASVL